MGRWRPDRDWSSPDSASRELSRAAFLLFGPANLAPVLDAAPLHEVANWMEEYRRFWDESFDRLDEYLHELQAQGQVQRMGKEKIRGREDSCHHDVLETL
jgi:hypothetical protein